MRPAAPRPTFTAAGDGPQALALAACWTGFEWLAARVPWVPYAWLNAGSSLAWHPALAAGAEVFGARFLTFWTVAAGASVPGLLALWGSRPVPRIIALTLLLALPALAGHARQSGLDAPRNAPAAATMPNRADAQPPRNADVLARVAVVQPGRTAGGLDRWIAPLRRHVSAQPVAAAVFPERFLAVPGPDLARSARALETDILIGALDADPPADGTDTLWYNAAFVQPADGPAPPPYRKTRLVPGLEATGVWPAAGRPLPTRGYAAGRDPRPLIVGGHPTGVMICYDSAFEATARALVRAGAEWLVVISNDDWLDPERPFRTTWAYWQHATHGRLRAIENRVSVIQAGATGYSFAVSPAGRGEPHALEPGVEGVAVLTATPRRGTTPFTRSGDILGLVCFAVFAAGAIGGALPAFTADGRSATLLG